MDEVCAFFDQRGIKFDVIDIDHGRQVKAQTGEIVAIYTSGKAVVQGKKTPLRDELEAWKNSGFAPSTVTQVAGKEPSAAARPLGPDRRIFIVYGHDTTAREQLELLLHRMKLESIVLDRLPAAGDTIIEKLEHYLGKSGNVGFACVLLTPDDEGHKAGLDTEKKYRARQNVILEMGMVLSRLGRSRVAVLTKESVEKPSDINGLL